MKKIFRICILTATVAAGLYSCKNQEKEITDLTDQFTSAYYKADFEKAAEYCDTEFKEKIMLTNKSFSILGDRIKEKAKELSKDSKLDIDNVARQGDTCYVVTYALTREGLDEPVKSDVTVINTKDGWKVKSLTVQKNQMKQRFMKEESDKEE